MTIQELKKSIEEKSIKDDILILVYNKNSFLANQYYKKIAEVKGKDIEYISSLESLYDRSIDIFSSDYENNGRSIKIFKTDKLSQLDEKILSEPNLIILTGKVDSVVKSNYNNNVVEMPDLEEWQIKDYMYSILKGVNTRYIDWLIKNCNNDIFRLQSEADKLSIFPEKERNIIFEKMIEDNAFGDITDQTIFDFTDSIVKKDINKLAHVYEDIDNIDIEAIGVVTILYQNFKKLIQVWMDKAASTETTGLSSKQIYAINKLPRVWSSKQLIDIFNFITAIDHKIKTGNMPMDILRDYMVIKILTR